MQFIPKSLEEIEAEEIKRKEQYLWAAGTKCGFRVLYGVEEKDGKYGPYFQADIRVFKDENTWLDLKAFLAPGSKKFLQFCEATGLVDRYQSGQIDTYDIEDKTGTCTLGIKRSPKKDGTGVYENNTIEEWIKPAGEVPKSIKASDTELNDSIPF